MLQLNAYDIRKNASGKIRRERRGFSRVTGTGRHRDKFADK